MEPMPLALEARSLNHWITREVPAHGILFEQPELRRGPLACGEVSCSQRHSQCAELGTTVLTMDACVAVASGVSNSV